MLDIKLIRKEKNQKSSSSSNEWSTTVYEDEINLHKFLSIHTYYIVSFEPESLIRKNSLSIIYPVSGSVGLIQFLRTKFSLF